MVDTEIEYWECSARSFSYIFFLQNVINFGDLVMNHSSRLALAQRYEAVLDVIMPPSPGAAAGL